MNITTGGVKWVKEGLRVQNSAIVLGDGRMYVVDNDIPPDEQRKLANELARRSPRPARPRW